MEYLIGSIVTAAIMLLAFNKIKSFQQKPLKINIGYSQSYVYSLIKPYVYLNSIINSIKKDTQTTVFERSLYVRVVLTGESAYWIKDNAFYIADVQNGEVLKETTRIVDTMGMDRVELDKMVSIVEELRKGLDDDRSDSGK